MKQKTQKPIPLTITLPVLYNLLIKSRTFCEEEQNAGKKGICREAKLRNAKPTHTHTHTSSIMMVSLSKAVIPSLHTVCLQSYTSLAPCLLPCLSFTMIFLYKSEIMCLTLNLSMLHNLSAEQEPSEDFITGMKSRFARLCPLASHQLEGQQAATLSTPPDLCPCWEIPQHS